LRVWLRAKHPCHGFRRARAALRFGEGREVNTKKVHRLWREEGLQVRVHSPRKRTASKPCGRSADQIAREALSK
jgi:putative transposase